MSVPASQLEVLVSVFRSVLGDQKAAYVAVPMSTGPSYFEWLRQSGVVPGTPEYWEGRKSLMERNVSRSRDKIADLRRRLPGPLIDPTQLGMVDGWSQEDFHDLWRRVFGQFVRALILLEGWECSVGCLIEVESAVSLQLPILDADLRPIALPELLATIHAVLQDLERAGFELLKLRSVATRIAHLPSK